MNEQNFDNQIRDSLGDYPSKLDTGALWKYLEPQLAADKKRRRGIFWWWSGAGVLLALGAWAWFALQNPQSLSSASDMAIENQTATQLPETTASGIQPADDVAGEATNTPAGQAERTVAVAKETMATTLRQTPEQQVAKLPKSTPKPGSKRNLPQATTFKQLMRPASGHAPAPTNRMASEPASPVVFAADPKSGTGAVREPGFVHKEETKVIAQQENSQTNGASSSAVVEQTPAITPLSPLAWLELKSLLTTDEIPPLLQVGTTKPRKKAAKTDLLLRPNFEIGYAFKTLEGRSYLDSVPNNNLLQARRESEAALEYLHANLLLGGHHSGWYALTGLGYTRITERFSFATDRTERDSVEGITEIYINAQGDSSFTQGLVERTRHISYRKRTYSSYTLLDVPLIAGYEWEKDRWSFGAEAGVFLNISMKAKGDALDFNNDFTRLEHTDWFKPSIGISYYGSLRIGYAIDEKTRISLGPTFRYVPDIADPDTNDFKQNYGLLGLNLGIARRF
ncbi:MAG: hypothetical protein SGI94_14940 [Saprospiraceae bacterium]|nr:hypothetical protein [Saprospiraceae bacterium]